MSVSIAVPRPNVRAAWLHRWVYYLASGFMFAAAALRALLLLQSSPLLEHIQLLLAAWLLAYLGSLLLAGRRPTLAALLTGAEIAATLALAVLTGADFFIFLFAIPCMQVMQRFSMRAAAILVGVTTLLTLLSLYSSHGLLFAFDMAVVYFGGTMLLVAYIASTRRASQLERQQQALVDELQQANSRLQAYSRQLQDLAAGRERQRLARELHDSVTQTIFSMTLTTQSALLLLDRDPDQVGQQLDRLDQLTQSALCEMQTLIYRLAPQEAASGGFVLELQKHLEERLRLENLSVSLEADGSQSLAPEEEAGLFRIVQEALNNVVKHAGVSKAVLRLHLAEPLWIEIEDCGAGFEARAEPGNGKLGLQGMRERADEIGWDLQVNSSPGNGTRIRVEKIGRGG